MSISSENKRFFYIFSVMMLALTLLSGCGSDTDDTGFIKFYNASENSPKIYLTVDEDLNSDDDDEVEKCLRKIEST